LVARIGIDCAHAGVHRRDAFHAEVVCSSEWTSANGRASVDRESLSCHALFLPIVESRTLAQGDPSAGLARFITRFDHPQRMQRIIDSHRGGVDKLRGALSG